MLGVIVSVLWILASKLLEVPSDELRLYRENRNRFRKGNGRSVVSSLFFVDRGL